LAGAVSEASGLGLIGGGYGDRDWLEGEFAAAGQPAGRHDREGKLAGAVDGEKARYRAAAAQGDTDTAVIFTGEGADLIDDVPSVGEIVTRLVAEAERALAAAARHVV
jgi:nitronate monooxygenase